MNLFHRLQHLTVLLSAMLFPLSGVLRGADGHFPASSKAVPLEVMTFNIRYLHRPDGPNYWDHRVAFVADTIKKHSPDIVGLQEAFRSQLDDLKPLLPDFAEVGVGREDGREKGEYSAILYRKSVLSVLESGTFWYSDTPTVPGSRSWGNKVTRICTWARFLHKPSGRNFWHFNSHWDHESAEARSKSARMLAERVAARNDRKEPVIVTGDFNAGEDSEPLKFLTGKISGSAVVFRDSFRVVNPEEKAVGTIHSWSGRTDGSKIDYILVEGATSVQAAEIMHDSRDGKFPSDHFPVRAKITLP
jgi:endonuclease/exonuclease/phosphatase family metal-dependent hydrolase